MDEARDVGNTDVTTPRQMSDDEDWYLICFNVFLLEPLHSVR